MHFRCDGPTANARRFALHSRTNSTDLGKGVAKWRCGVATDATGGRRCIWLGKRSGKYLITPQLYAFLKSIKLFWVFCFLFLRVLDKLSYTHMINACFYLCAGQKKNIKLTQTYTHTLALIAVKVSTTRIDPRAACVVVLKSQVNWVDTSAI